MVSTFLTYLKRKEASGAGSVFVGNAWFTSPATLSTFTETSKTSHDSHTLFLTDLHNSCFLGCIYLYGFLECSNTKRKGSQLESF